MRCVTDDLPVAGYESFDSVARHEIVRELLNQHHENVDGADPLRPEAGDRTLWVLRYGNDHRGVSWFDARSNVVWLCGYGRHRSGQPDDAYPRFLALRSSGEIWPTEVDGVALHEDRDERFGDFVTTEAPALLDEARGTPGVECSREIGMHRVGMLVIIVETLEETFVVVPGARILPDQVIVLLASLYPDRPYDDWRVEQTLPTRPLDLTQAEVCFSIVHE